MANNLRNIWVADPDAAPKERPSFADDVVGRFRSGRLVKTGRTEIPESLNEWRVTTGDPVVAAKIAELLGGEPEEWETDKEDNLQVLTDAKTVQIIIEPDGVDASFKQFIHGVGLTHHCDGFTILSTPEEMQGQPCKCPSLIAERKMSAQRGGPKPSVDVTFRLADAPELGKFRFNSGSWKLVEALGPLFADLDRYGNTADGESGAEGVPVRASLTIENVTYVPKKGPRAGQTVSYNKPVIKVFGAYSGEAAEDAIDMAKAA
ncbi:hypothetical protein ACF1DV_25935 [Streptomyces achromogenes]|uniref:recombination directionality factor n=1 Tax=Streptomyces achromogenes TaxID=67255 RepID=UPI0036F7D950